jgi:hypothetical protein
MGRRDSKWIKRRGVVDTRGRGTLELAAEFIAYSNAIQKSLHAKWWNHPILRFSRIRNVLWLREQIKEISGELSDRYKGVMGQLFQRMGSDGNFGEVVQKAWYGVRASTVKMADHRVFSTTLWFSFVTSAQLQEAQPLKPKFMLRQFVDEIASCKEQGVLIAMAYGPRATSRPSGDEILHNLSAAYVLLHAEVTRCSSDVRTLTDGEILSSTVANMAAPYVRYEEWLFNC